MDSIEMTCNSDLFDCLEKSGVREDTLHKLEEDEINDVGLLESASDELLRTIGIKGGQLVLLRKGVNAFKESLEANTVKENTTPTQNLEASSPAHTSVSSRPQLPSMRTPAHTLRVPSSHTTSDSSPQPCPSSTGTQETDGNPVSAIKCLLESPKLTNKNWINKFELPTLFSPAILAELSAKKLSATRRNEFTRDICSSIRAHTLNPTRAETEHIALMIIRKYPFLTDTTGTGFGSWQAALKNRLKNLRKTKRPHPSKDQSKTKETPKPKLAKREVDRCIPDLADGETDETCKEHVCSMKKEMAKTTNRNTNLLKELMEITFPYRRKRVMLEPVSVSSFLDMFPALQLVSQLKAEFGRVVGNKELLEEMTTRFRTKWQSNILALLRNKDPRNPLLVEAQDVLLAEPGRKAEIEEAVAVLLLPTLVKDRGGNGTELIKICSDDESIDEMTLSSSTPRIVGSGKLGKISPLYLAAEGVIVCKLPNIDLVMSLSLVVGLFYVFNMQYPTHSKSVFVLLECILMNITNEGRKRVQVNKILKELS